MSEERQGQPAKIEILVGAAFLDPNTPVYWEEEKIDVGDDYCFALVINGDNANSIRLKYSGQTIGSACESAGKELRGKLKEIEAEDYVLVNGQRIRHSTKERINCFALPYQDLEIFEQYLRGNTKKKGWDSIKEIKKSTA